MKMKVMKTMKAAPMKKSMKKRVSKIAKGRFAKSLVLKGKKVKTVGGLLAKDLKKNKRGKVVSKKASAFGAKNKWIAAVTKARKALGIKGFHVIGGKSAKGVALLKKAKSF